MGRYIFQHVLALAAKVYLAHLTVYIVIAIMKIISISSMNVLKLFKHCVMWIWGTN